MDYEMMTKEELIEHIHSLQHTIYQYEQEINRLRGKNPRGAGRKPANPEWIANYTLFTECYRAGKSMAEIMQECNCSRSTYYRYKRLYDATNFDSKLYE